MLEILGKKYYHIFTAGNYPQADINYLFLQNVVNSYNKKFHEAPVWVGHYDFSNPNLGEDEPEALAWIDSLLLEGDKLFASFSYVSEDMIELINEQTFKYCSAEFVYYEINAGTSTPYLYALALTNRPAVKGLEPLAFPAQFTDHICNKNFKETPLRFTQENNKYSHKQTKINMNQILLDIAKAMNIDVTKFTDDAKLADAVKLQFSDTVKKVADLTTEVAALKKPAETPALSPEAKQFADRVSTLEKERCESLADSAVASGKVLPANRDSIVAFANKDYDEAKKFVTALPVNSVFAEQQIKDNKTVKDLVDLDNPKFKDKNGKPLLYSEVIKDFNLCASFTEAELSLLRSKDPIYGQKK